MAPLTFPQPHRKFFLTHQRYFEERDAGIVGMSWQNAYKHGGAGNAKSVWDSYRGAHAHLRDPYKAESVEKDDFTFEPPLESNGWEGAEVPTPYGEDPGGEDSTDEELDNGEAADPVDKAGTDGIPGPSSGAPLPQKSKSKRPAEDPLGGARARKLLMIEKAGGRDSDFPNDPGELPDGLKPPGFGVAAPQPNDRIDFDYKGGKEKFGDLVSSKIAKVKEIDGESGHNWHCQKIFATGTFGIASRWVLLDNEGTLLKTLVTKDCSALEDWTWITTWSDDTRATPREIAVHRVLNPPANAAGGSQYFITYFGYRLNSLLKCYRILMKEARLSDLQNMAITFHPQEKTFRQKGADPEITDFSDDGYEWLPTAFVWELFAAMIAGFQHLHNAGIVHRDFKPANVFLDIADSEEEEHLHGWKVRPLIADYGSCMPLVPARYNNPDDFDFTKTEPYNAPEQWITYPPIIEDPMNSHRAYPMAEPADVLALGMTMWMIIRTATHPGKTVGKAKPPKEKKRATALKGKKMLYDAAVKTRPDDVVKHIDDFMETWGEAQVGQVALHAHWKARLPLLLDMIKQCLHWDPSERPTLDVLSEQVKAHLVDPSSSAPAGVERETFFQYLRPSAPTAEDGTGNVETPGEDAEPEEGVGKGKSRAKRAKR